MGAHLIDGTFQSDKYPTTPAGKVPLSVKDKDAQDLLWEYAQRHRARDAEFSADLEAALKNAGFVPPTPDGEIHDAGCCYTPSEMRAEAQRICPCEDRNCGMVVRCKDHPDSPVHAKYVKRTHSIKFICPECDGVLPTVHLDEQAHAH